MHDSAYYATRGRTYLEIAKGILFFCICLITISILIYTRKLDLFTPTGIVFVASAQALSAWVCYSYLARAYTSIYHPIVRILDEYLILDFDRAVFAWDYIKEIKIVGSTIFLTKKKEKWLWNEKTERLSYVPDRRDLVQKLIEYCEKYDIPCKVRLLDQL